MTRRQEPNPGSIISEFLQRHPETISVLVRNRMACPGCPMAPFETLEDAMRAYQLDPRRFLGELKKAIHCSTGTKTSRKTTPPRRS